MPTATTSSLTASISTSTKLSQPPSRWQLLYDTVMMMAIIIDLLLMGLDALLLSNFMAQLANWFGFSQLLSDYQQHWHQPIKVAGGFFTIFLVIELLVRWVIAIAQRRYYRWFFFPFIHWYEVLGCAPQLRALRLFRVAVIGYNLHQLGYQILPASWIKSGKFYYDVVMEEISDRVILTAIDNIRSEIQNTDGHLVQNIINKHRDELQTVIVEMLEQEVTPLLQASANTTPTFAQPLAKQVGQAIQQSLSETPELRRIMRLIPIAGHLIESQMHSLGQHIGENITLTLTKNLTQPQQLEAVYQEVAKTLAQIDVTSPALEKLVSEIIDDSLTALANQVRIQQWKHHAK